MQTNNYGGYIYEATGFRFISIDSDCIFFF